MQNIDQEKLAEFINQLSELQIEAVKTASVEVYDRFTISKLEDHVVDLYQLSINAEHEGLQFLCKCLRDNIRDHFITGTNISDEEFILMNEWKSLVKAYLSNSDNQKVVDALATNLSKSGWISPLKNDEKENAIIALLGQESDQITQFATSNQVANSAVGAEFDSYMQDSSSSMAEVFSSSEDSDGNDDIDDITSLFDDDEPSLAECFQGLEFDEEDEDINIKEELSADVSEPELKESLDQQEEISEIKVTNEELSQIAQPAELSDEDRSYDHQELENQSESLDENQQELQANLIKSELNANNDIDKIEVSSEELAEIQKSTQTEEDESFVESEEHEISEESINLDESKTNAEKLNALFKKSEQDKIEVSEEELAEIQKSVTDAIEDELFVDDGEHEALEENINLDESESSAETLNVLSDESVQDKVEVAEEELAEIQESSVHAIEDELFVEDDEHEASEENINLDESDSSAKTFNTLFKKSELNNVDASEKNAVEIQESNSANEQSDDNADVCDEEFAEVQEQAIYDQANELHVDESLSQREEYIKDYEDLSDSNETSEFISQRERNLAEITEAEQADFDKSLRSSKDDSFYINDVDNYNQYAIEEGDNNLLDDKAKDELPSDMTIAEEAIFGRHHADIDDASGFVDTSIEKVIEIADESTEADTYSYEHKQDSAPVETVYIEPIKQPDNKKDNEPRSIIEAYVDAIANKPQTNKPNELEQELIDEPVVEKPAVELESVEKVLEKYSDWSDEQKELLSLILSEVKDVIDQQEETLKVLHESPANEEAVLDVVSLYAEQIERMGSAAEMVGLDALQKLCELIGFHFGDLARASTEMIIKSEELINKWAFIIYSYLRDIYDENAHQEAIDYISEDDWARTIREDIKADLKQAFTQSTILIDEDERDKRLTTASGEHVDITVPDDVQAELLDGLLQELPFQTEELSSAIHELISDEYLKQLEVSQRIAHTVKGAANTVGVSGIAILTHQLEDILQALLKAQVKPNKDLHSALVDASDCLEQMTEYLLDQGDHPADAVQTLQTLLDWANYIDEFGPPKSDDSEVPVNTNASDKKVSTNTEEDKTKLVQENSLRVPANMIDELINQSGESIIANSQMHENVTRLLRSLRDIKKNREDVYTMSQQLEHMIDVQGALDKFTANNENEKFDPLELDEYNELHTYSRRLIEATADSVELVKDLEERLYDLESVIADQSRAQKDNQYSILKARMAPIDSIVARLKRGVRQSAKISQKNVELEVLGAEILLDSKILNNLVDPLMHLLRNAVDHGVEEDSVREANDKPIPAVIKLSFQQVGERLEISCIDDGQGLDTDKIKNRALDKELIKHDQQLSDHEIHQIIMRHGFSTRDEITQLSGRGVGMDVVYSNIKNLNGSVQIQSERNKGVTVEMSLPVSLLTAHVLLASTSSGTMAIATRGIEEIIQINEDDLEETEDGLTLKIEQGEYSAIYLDQLLNNVVTVEDNKQSYSGLLIESNSGEKKVVLVDEIQSVKDIIIKPFSHYLPKVDGLIGATVLGNGNVAAVIDVSDLLSVQSGLVSHIKRDLSADLEVIHQASVLVVEDSISTRRSLAEFMQDLNYKVFTAKDGVEAVEIMRHHVPNIVLTDLEMPRMNGLELTSYVRSHDETKDVPVIMLTSRTTEKHKQEARSIGVNEYLTKPFVEDILLEKVQYLSSKQ